MVCQTVRRFSGNGSRTVPTNQGKSVYIYTRAYDSEGHEESIFLQLLEFNILPFGGI